MKSFRNIGLCLLLTHIPNQLMTMSEGDSKITAESTIEEEQDSKQQEQQKKDAELIAAVCHATHQDVVSWLEKGANPNSELVSQESWGTQKTPVIRFAIDRASNNPEILRTLITHKADFSSFYQITTPSGNSQFRSPLHDACGMTGNDNAVQILLNAGASCNALNHNQSTPLQIAASAKRKNTVIELIKAGSRVNSRDTREHTPLSYSCVWIPDLQNRRLLMPDIEIVKLLIFSKADVNKSAEKMKSQAAPLPELILLNTVFNSKFGFGMDETTYEQLSNFHDQLDQLIANGLTDKDRDQARHSILERTGMNAKNGNLFLQIRARESGRRLLHAPKASDEDQTQGKPSGAEGDRKDN